jgi:hypothetical protein
MAEIPNEADVPPSSPSKASGPVNGLLLEIRHERKAAES